jgi:UDP-2-acetamido-2,6-beta-L-arabino-hexul-4-ose reductase
MPDNIKKLEEKKDNRGRLIELVRQEDIGINGFGQILMTSVLPGKTKGGHYHMRKKEWFAPVSGKGTLVLLNIKTGEEKSHVLSSGKPVLVRVDPFWNHVIENSGTKELIIIIYISEPFDKKDPDTFLYDK